jgi:hypothetical protein
VDTLSEIQAGALQIGERFGLLLAQFSEWIDRWLAELSIIDPQAHPYFVENLCAEQQLGLEQKSLLIVEAVLSFCPPGTFSLPRSHRPNPYRAFSNACSADVPPENDGRSKLE